MENNWENTEELDARPEELYDDECPYYEETDEDYNPSKNPGKFKRYLLGALALLFAAGVLFFSWVGFNLNKGDAVVLEDSIKAKLGQLEDKSNAEIRETLNQVIEEGTMLVSINANPVFVDGTSAGSLKIENSPMNHYGQKVVITLKDSGKEIYDSGYIPAGYYIQEDTLSVDLEAGEYEAVATFTGYNEETHAKIGQVYAELKISVLS